MLKGRLTAYSGLTTKIRAMKKLLLSDSQYEEIAHISTVPELIRYLQAFPSYASVLSDLDPDNAHRGEVESRMTFSTYYDFSKIFHFSGESQKKYLEYFFMKYEIAVLKTCLRNIMDSRTETEPLLINKHFKRHSKFDVDKLSSCETLEDYISTLEGTVYEKPIKKIWQLENPILFDFEIALDLFFFNYIWSHQNVFVPKRENKLFRDIFGTNIDLLNILWIYRCKNYYNLSDSQIYSFLIPIYYNLERSDIKVFVEAGSNKEFFEQINRCSYGRTYGFDPTLSIESQFGGILDNIYMKEFKESPYSLAVINAYFHLKNLEVAKVVTAMECIRYGYKPEVISQYINQKRGVL